MLQYAVSDQFVSLIDFSFTTYDTLDPYANRYCVGERHRVLLLPSFSTGAISVGFGVNERISSASSFACRERYTGRIVRDDHLGTSLFMAEDLNLNLVEVQYLNLVSPVHRENVFCLFHRKKFRKALQSINTNFDHNAMKEALVYYCYSVEGRPCSKCGDLVSCTCKLAVAPKRHPLDSESELRNLTSYTGQYQGVVTLSLYEKGKSVFLSNYKATSCINLTSDTITRQKLALWALCSAVQKVEVNPVKLILNEAEALKTRPSTATDAFLLKSVAESLVSEAEEESPNGAVSKAVTQLIKSSVEGVINESTPKIGLGNMLVRVASAAQSNGVDLSSFLRLDANSSSQATDLLSSMGVSLLPTLLNSNSNTDPLSTSHSTSEAKTAASCDESISMGDVEMEDSPEAVAEADGKEDSGSSSDANMSPSLTSTGPNSSSEPSVVAHSAAAAVPADAISKNVPSVSTGRPLVALAPAGFGDGISKDKDGEMDDRRRKMELRKARNRESAHRSNQRRKMQIQKLKEEIEAANTKEANLRAREKMLREENMSLRTAAFR